MKSAVWKGRGTVSVDASEGMVFLPHCQQEPSSAGEVHSETPVLNKSSSQRITQEGTRQRF